MCFPQFSPFLCACHLFVEVLFKLRAAVIGRTFELRVMWSRQLIKYKIL